MNNNPKSVFKNKYFLAAIIFAIGFLIIVLIPKPSSNSSQTAANLNQINTSPSVQINNVNIPVEIAKTSSELQKGLSGRTSLNQNSGMLFVFPAADLYHFWMPDMNFPIDIIWINNNKVIDITAHASKDFNPANPVYYTPQEPAQYVLEVNAGFANNKNIKIGDSVIFNNIK